MFCHEKNALYLTLVLSKQDKKTKQNAEFYPCDGLLNDNIVRLNNDPGERAVLLIAWLKLYRISKSPASLAAVRSCLLAGLPLSALFVLQKSRYAHYCRAGQLHDINKPGNIQLRTCCKPRASPAASLHNQHWKQDLRPVRTFRISQTNLNLLVR
jgi:hypothetical protein